MQELVIDGAPQLISLDGCGGGTVKRLLRGNIEGDGKLDSVRFAKAILKYRKTPFGNTGRPLVQVIYGRQLSDPGCFSRSPWEVCTM